MGSLKECFCTANKSLIYSRAVNYGTLFSQKFGNVTATIINGMCLDQTSG
jgi:hypothetical protein